MKRYGFRAFMATIYILFEEPRIKMRCGCLLKMFVEKKNGREEEKNRGAFVVHRCVFQV